MNNLQPLIDLIETKVRRWESGSMGILSDDRPSTLTYGIALKSSLLFELLIQECNRALLPHFPHLQNFAPPWRSAIEQNFDRQKRRRCLSENLSLLQTIEQELAAKHFQLSDPRFVALGDQLRRARNKFVHPSGCFCEQSLSGQMDLHDMQFVSRLVGFLRDLKAFCQSDFIQTIAQFEVENSTQLDLEEFFPA